MFPYGDFDGLGKLCLGWMVGTREFYTDGPSRSTKRYEGPPASIVPTWEMKVNNPPSGNVVMTPINDGVWQAGKMNNIDFGTAIVKEGRSFDIGLGPMDYSSAEMGSGSGKGNFYCLLYTSDAADE